MKIMNPKIMPMIKRFVLLIFIIAFHVTLCLAEGETLDSTTPPETTAPTSSEPETTATPEATATTSYFSVLLRSYAGSLRLLRKEGL